MEIIVEYGNLALKEYEYQTEKKKNTKRKSIKVKRNREQMLNRKKSIRRMAAVIVMAISAGFMISEFVAVNETRQQLRELTKELDSQEAVTSQKIFELEQSIDLDEIEKIATTRLGMQRPESYQTIYVNVKSDDVTEATAGEVEGVGNSIAAFFKNIGSYIVNAFSIK